MKRGKKYAAVSEKVNSDEKYDISDGVALIKSTATASFDESVEMHARLGIDPKKGDQVIRGMVSLPHGTGKETRVGVITSTKEAEAKKAGADLIGAEDLIDKIKAGKLPDVDVLVASPEMMPKLAPAAKILGPRGMMPSPKTETVTTDIERVVSELKKGKESFKNDGGGNIHQVIGKASFDEKKLEENYTVFMEALTKARTEACKGPFILAVSLCTTMGPSVKIKV